MRRINTILVLMILALFADHAIFASLHSIGVGNGVIKAMAHSMLGLVLIHAAVSLIVTVKAEKAGITTKARYNKENREFWNRRVTGVLILVLGVTHAYLMNRNERGIPRIAFAPKIFELTTPLLVITIYLHIMTNIRSLLISLGIRNIDRNEKIIKAITSVVMAFVFVAISYVSLKYMGGH